MQAVILGLVRHVLTALGGAAILKGYIDTAGVEAVVGAVMTLAGIAWSVFEKRQRP
jgi:hypothetical protein